MTDAACSNIEASRKHRRKNSQEELKRKRLLRIKKKKEKLKGLTKKERVAFWKNKATEPLQKIACEREVNYEREKKVAAFYWKKWKEDRAKHLDDITREPKYICHRKQYIT
ncbi:hypothetical protein AC249_AIPGENE11000 [Exaiptasia diaphana]|nr:hypothetical protein AC249_AIPGENE11000 [Exaiptasia diaphana]